jgi:diguanylate cyclase (GGDEF)-like protein
LPGTNFKQPQPAAQVATAPAAPESPAPAVAETVVEPVAKAEQVEEVEAAAKVKPTAETVVNSAAQSSEQRGLVGKIKGILEHNEECDRPMSLILVDVDHLKRLNETNGTTTGDVVLRAVMQFLTAGLRDIDTLTRLDGDCFALTLRRADLDYTIQVAERVRNAIGLCKLRVGENQVNFTISTGLAEAGTDDDAEVLYLRSNLALQAAKAAGRNCTFYHDGLRCEPVSEVGQEAQPAMA